MPLINVLKPNPGDCPNCGRKLVVWYECGYCKWRHTKQPEVNPDDMANVGRWSFPSMIVLVLLASLIPLIGIFSSVYGIMDDKKRTQGVFLLGFTLMFGGILTFIIMNALS